MKSVHSSKGRQKSQSELWRDTGLPEDEAGGAAYPQGGGKNGRQFAERVRDAFRAPGKKQGVSGQPEGTADDSRASDGGPPDGSLTIKRNKKLDIAARIGCVLVALVIWVYVMANDSPAAERTFESISVQLTGQSEFSLISGITDVSVTIKGRRGFINQLDESAIQAFIDISSVKSPGWQKVNVDVSVPSGTTLHAVSPSSLLLYFGNNTTVTVPVDVDIAEYTLPEDYVLGIPAAKPAEITVTGPEDLLAQIKSARATITLGQVSGSVTAKAPLTLVDGDGKAVTSSFIKMQMTEATVDIPVYRQVNLPLTLGFKHGYYNPGNVHISWSPETILVMGETSAIENARWHYTIDEKGIPGDGQFTIPITLTEGLTNVSGITEATLTIKHIGTTTKQITLTNFAVINPENFSYSLVTDELNVTLRGTPTNLSYISDKNVTATIDLSGFKNPSGSVMAPVTISVPPGLGDSVYEIGIYSMMVKLG